MTPRILVCTTFRSFDGSANDRIQREFLRSLAAQTYSEWELVVTRFREQGVEQALEAAGVPFVTCAGTGDYRFSHTEVLENGVERADARGPGSSILLWTTCDVIFPTNLFAEIVRRFRPGDAGTSHPHYIAASFDDYVAERIVVAFPYGRLSPEPVGEGIDFIYADADLFAQGTSARRALHEYRFVDWGLFEHFLTGLAQLHAARRLNLWPVVPVVKIANDRARNAETVAYFDRSWNRNYAPMRRFLDEHALDDDLLGLDAVHAQYDLAAPARYVWRVATARLHRATRARARAAMLEEPTAADR